MRLKLSEFLFAIILSASVGYLIKAELVGFHGPYSFADLDSGRKVLVLQIIEDLRNPKETEYYTKLLAQPFLMQQIDTVYARKLRDNYAKKVKLIALYYNGTMSVSQNLRHDTDSRFVWLPADALVSFTQKILKYGADNNTVTGMKIVFGSYPYDPNDDQIVNHVRINGDTLSGRTTVYLVGTYDTMPDPNSKYNAYRQKEILNISTAIKTMDLKGMIPDYENHGTLCPDSCSNP